MLREGSRGKAVLELKEKLADATDGPPVFAMTPVWGKGVDAGRGGVQQEHGLGVDGVVGADTWRALDRVRMPA